MKRDTCPKCGHELRFLDWREECPCCGVNMSYYNKNELLLQDADRAEIEFALFQPRLDRAKASFIGSPLAVTRLICSLLPVAALLLPLTELQCTAQAGGQQIQYTIITVIEALKSNGWETLFGVSTEGVLLPLLLLAASLLCLILHFIGILGGCTQKGRRFLFAMDTATVTLAIGSAAALHVFLQNSQQALPQAIERFSMGYGVYVFIGLLVLCLLTDILTAVRGIPVRHTQRYIGSIPAEEYFAAHPECSM